MIHGLRTVVYPVSDLSAAKAWYSKVLEFAPYFDEAFYVGYTVGGFELGLIPDGTPGASGGLAYWATDDIVAELSRLHSLGAGEDAPVTDVGGGIKVASVRDPFGNAFGIIEHPNFDRALVR